KCSLQGVARVVLPGKDSCLLIISTANCVPSVLSAAANTQVMVSDKSAFIHEVLPVCISAKRQTFYFFSLIALGKPGPITHGSVFFGIKQVILFRYRGNTVVAVKRNV